MDTLRKNKLATQLNRELQGKTKTLESKQNVISIYIKLPCLVSNSLHLRHCRTKGIAVLTTVEVVAAIISCNPCSVLILPSLQFDLMLSAKRSLLQSCSLMVTYLGFSSLLLSTTLSAYANLKTQHVQFGYIYVWEGRLQWWKGILHPPHQWSMRESTQWLSSLYRYILVLKLNLTLCHCLNKQHPFIHFVTAYSVLRATGEVEPKPATVS